VAARLAYLGEPDPFEIAAERVRRGVKTNVRGLEDEYIGPAIGATITSLGELVERAKEESTSAALGGDYNAQPALEVATNLIGGGTPFAVKGSAGIFGGRISAAANRATLREAEEMAAKGASKGEIFDKTGWFQGPEGGWKFEIPDRGAKYVREPMLARMVREHLGDQAPPQTLGSRFRHKELEKAYPGYGDEIKFGILPVNEPRSTKGGFDPATNTILLHPSLSPEEAKSVILHELQHWVDKREAFARGGNLTTPEVLKVAEEAAPRFQQVAADFVGNVRRSAEEFKANNPNASATDFWNAQPSSLLKEYEDAKRLAADPEVAKREAAYQAYTRLAGETGARNVQTRADFTLQARKEKPPWVTEDYPPEGQIVAHQDQNVLPFSMLRTREEVPVAVPGVPTKPREVFENETLANPPFPQYAEAYPENVPGGVPKLDKKKGTYYQGKALTPEAEAFAEARAKVRADMEREGFTPYYDPAKRFDVDPANYPMNVNTELAVPAKQQTVDKWMAKIGAEESRKALREAYAAGMDLGETTGWYLMGQLERDFINELGPEAGRKAFGDRFAAAMAATTSGAAPEQNLLLAVYGNMLRTRNMPYPTASYEVPYPIGGGKYGVMGNLEQHKRIMDEGGLAALGLENPKRHDFAFDFAGHKRPVMDEQMMTGMVGKATMKKVDPVQHYGIFSRVASEEGAHLPDVRDFQSAGWYGLKDMAGSPMIQTVNEAIERTHRLTGMSRAEIVKRALVRGEIPLYGVGGMAALGALGEEER
jgi:Large polyvalent protein associated domain 23